jgi:hypothetical protein
MEPDILVLRTIRILRQEYQSQNAFKAQEKEFMILVSGRPHLVDN